MNEAELAIVRRVYAMQVLAKVGVSDLHLEDAYATVRREHYLGPGPWQHFRFRAGYVPTPSADPVYLYTDDLFAIDTKRGLNNGEPSLHAYLVHRAAPQEGEHVVHVGAGVGYYTAILAHLVGPRGRVTGIEIDEEIAARAHANFTDAPNVSIVTGDGGTVSFDDADVIYVNAGATRPADAWLDRLKDGGRLILPLTTGENFVVKDLARMGRTGAVFRITRDSDVFHAKWISPVAIFPCAGNRDEESEQALAAAFAKGEAQRVTRLYRTGDIAEDKCWLRARDWSLAWD